MYNLTEGSLDNIMNGIDIDKPVLQILGYKKLLSTSGDRYRLLVSDGKRVNSLTMLATQLNHLITDQILTEYTICEISQYALSTVNNAGKEKHVMVIVSLNVIAPGSEVGHQIGSPTDNKADPEPAKLEANASTAKMANTSAQTSSTVKKNTSMSNCSLSDACTIPISALSPYQNRWVIKVRVTNKSAIRTWSNSRGEGKLFSMNLIDESGEIRCTAFRDQCDKFYDMIEIGNVYYISRCTIKAARKEFNTLKNNYEMAMTNDTEIAVCRENNDNIPKLQFEFCSISQVENKERNDMIDVLGVVTTVNDVQHIVQRTTGRELVKRDISIIDDSNTMVTVTLWGQQADDFDGSNNPILAIKAARVGEFNGGKNLSLISSSVLKKDPDLPEAHRLRAWYTAGGHSETVKSLSKTGGGTGGGDISASLYTFQEVSEAKLGEKLNLPDLYAVVATINTIRVENSIYKACPSESCKKKLIDQSTGVFRCEKCNKEYPNFIYRLLMSMNIADATGSRWITAFNEDAEKILGMTAYDLGEMKESDNDAYMQKFGEANLKRFLFNIRAKSEVFQDEMRVRHTCVSVTPLNYKTHMAHLIDKISKLEHIEKLDPSD